MVKILYVILFCIIYGLTDIVLFTIAFVQTLLNLFTDGPSESLKDFGKSLGIYLKQISEYTSYGTDEKPFPFSDWPQVRSEDKALDEIN